MGTRGESALPEVLRWALDPKQLIWLAAFGVCLLGWREFLAGDADLATHIAMGRHLLEGGLPSDNPLLYTTDVPPVLHEWLFEWTVAALERLGGLGLVLVVMAAVAAFVPTSVYVVLRERGVEVRIATAAAGLTLFGTNYHLLARPHVVTWLCLVWWWKWISGSWRRDRHTFVHRLAPILLSILWANTHGGFLSALAVAGLVALVEYVAARVAITGAPETASAHASAAAFVASLAATAAVATLANPFGWRLHGHLFSFLGNGAALSRVTDFRGVEWSLSNPGAAALWLLLVAATLAALAVGRFAIRASEAAVLVAAAAGAFAAVRGVPIFAVLASLIGGEVLQRGAAPARMGLAGPQWAGTLHAETMRLEPTGPSRSWNWVSCAMAVALVAALCVRVPLAGKRVPREALELLRTRDDLVASRGYTDFLSGGYVLYGTPVERVFIHPLNALYPPELFARYDDVQSGALSWTDLAREFGFAWALVDSDPLRRRLETDSCWDMLTDEPAGKLFVARGDCE